MALGKKICWNKAIVHTKLIIIHSPSSCSKHVWVSIFYWTQKKIFWRMLLIKYLMVAIDFHIGKIQLFGYQKFFKISPFVFEGAQYMMIELSFWENYAFKCGCVGSCGLPFSFIKPCLYCMWRNICCIVLHCCV